MDIDKGTNSNLDIDATYQLAMKYLQGIDVAPDLKQAIYYFKQIAEYHEQAAYNLGFIYEKMATKEQGVDIALLKIAQRYYLLSARLGSQLAVKKLQELGVAYIQKLPVRPDIIPLSFAQQRLWFAQQIANDPAAYNMPAVLRIKGNINIHALEQAFKAIIERHENLRTVFIEQEGTPIQIVHASTPFSITYTDLSTLPEVKRKRLYETAVHIEANKAFDLTQGPLIRVQLITHNNDDYDLLITLHHIISDGWSVGLLIKELNIFYNAYCQGVTAELPPLTIQYVDFTLWQHSFLQGHVIKQQLDYWQQQLKDVPPVLSLPTDYPRPAMLDNAGGQQRIEIPAGLVSRLQHLPGTTAQTSLFMRLLATFNILLYRYTGQEDFIVGTRIANRHYSEVEDLVGFFANTLALRCQIDKTTAFIDLLNRITEDTLQAYANQDLPFERLVEELKVERSLSYAPLVQVVFILQNNDKPEFKLQGLMVDIEQMKSEDEGLAKTDLTVSLASQNDGSIIGTVQYAKALFKAETISHLIENWLQLMQSIVDAPNEVVGKLPLLSFAQRQQMLEEWNPKVITTAQTTMVACWEEQVIKSPHQTAVYFEEQSFTYDAVNQRANQLAYYLKTNCDIKPGTIIGIYYPRSIELVVAILAVLKTGAAYLALDPHYPEERLKIMIEDSELSLLLSDKPLNFDAPVTVINTKVLTEVLANQPASNLGQAISPQAMAYLVYTSGSTGQPKGVKIAHANVLNYIAPLAAKMQLTPHDIYAHTASFSFSSSVRQLFLPLLNGATIALTNDEQRRDPQALIVLTKALNITVWDIVPSYWQSILHAVESVEDLATLRLVVAASEALSWSLVKAWQAKIPHTRLMNMYGQTETAGIVCIYPITVEHSALGLVPIGRPLANVQAYVLDEFLQPLPIGLVGDLYIGGASISLGYHQLPDLTRERFIAHPFYATGYLYKTGDKARLLADGTIEYIGRADFQIKLRGYRIELGEIEAILRQIPEIAEAVVSAYTMDDGEQKLVAYLINSSNIIDKEQHIKAIRHYLQNRLPSYMLPSHYVFLERLPLTASGKIDRKALPKPDTIQTQNYIAPQTNIEKMLATIYAHLLKLDKERISTQANFFELGGHSLLATRLVSELCRAFKIRLNLIDIFQSPILADLANKIEQKTQSSISTQPQIHTRQRSHHIPLSFTQQRIWFLDKLIEDKSIYNMPPIGLRLTGYLNIAALQKAVDHLLQRHEILRTRIAEVDGVACQVVEENLRFSIECKDIRATFSAMDNAEKEKYWQEVYWAEAKKPFNLNHAPLIRIQLNEVTDTESLLLITLHHIVGDGWSMAVLGREISELYNHYAYNEALNLASLPIQYADYAIWQREFIQGEYLDQELNYWQQQLAGAPTVIELPTDKPRPKVMSYQGKTYRYALPASLVNKLQKLSLAQDATLFMSLLTSFYILLYRYSGQSDIVIGSAIANRTLQETENLIGFFVNTIALRGQLQPTTTFVELLAQVKETLLNAYEHQYIPFEKLVDHLQIERELNRTPLFQVMLQLLNYEEAQLNLKGVNYEGIPAESGQSRFDLCFTAELRDTGEIQLLIEYATDLYESETIAKLACHWKILLEGIVAQPGFKACDLPLLTDQEKKLLLLDWNQTSTEYLKDKAIHQLFEEQVERTPDNIAVVFEKQQLTYRELNTKANQLAHYLIALGVKPDTLVAISLDRSIDLIIGLLGILKAGGAYVPLDPTYPQERLEFMLEDAKSTILITQNIYQGQFTNYQGEVISLDNTNMIASLASQPKSNPSVRVLPSNLAYIIYTSGSTGQPKGVMIEHGNVQRLFSATHAWYGFNEHDVWTLFHSYAFDFTVWEIWGALFYGAKLVIVPYLVSRSPEEFYQLLAEQQVTVLNQTPSAFQQLIAYEGTLQALPKLALRYIIFGGEALELSSLLPWFERHGDKRPQLINMYGITETTVHVTYKPIDIALAKANRGSIIGRQIPDLTIYILDNTRQLVPIGVTGELYVGGSGVARGYLNRPELTSERFINNPFGEGKLYKTGDLVRYLLDGNLEYLGRSDFQVKIRGFRIELGEIENLIRQHEDIQDAALIARNDLNSKRLVAYLVIKKGAGDQAQVINSVRQLIQQRLPDYMMPSAFVVMESLPINANGKLDRKALPKPEYTAMAEYVAPATEIEQTLVNVCAKLLNISHEKISITAKFFDLGGHSLLATRFITQLSNHFHIELTVKDIFEHRLLKDLAKLIEAKVMLKATEIEIDNLEIGNFPNDFGNNLNQ